MPPRPASLLVLVAGLTGCGARTPDAPEVHIGVLASLTGARVRISGESTRDGAELAARDINDAGGVDVGGVRHRVRIVYADVGEATDQATSAAQSLLTRPDIVAIVGPQYSRNALPVAVLAENAHVPMISPMASHPAVTAGRRWVFRIAFTDDAQAAALARWAHDGLRARRAAMLYEESASYSRSVADAFTAAFQAGGGRIVARETYTRDRATDFSAAMRRLRDARPDVVLLPNELPDDTLQLRQAALAGLRVPVLIPDFVDARLMASLPAAGGLYTTHHWHADRGGAESRTFVARFTRALRHPPNATAAATYDAVRLVADAIRRGGSTAPDQVRDAIAATRAWPGVAGPLDFAGRQDPGKRAIVLRLDGGRLVPVGEAAP